MLALSQVENRHNGSFFVLWWIALEDLFDELIVLFCELEGDVGIVFWRVSVLIGLVSSYICSRSNARTTWRASLAALELAENVRHCDCEAGRTDRKAERKTKGVILEAIVAMLGRNRCMGV